MLHIPRSGDATNRDSYQHEVYNGSMDDHGLSSSNDQQGDLSSSNSMSECESVEADSSQEQDQDSFDEDERQENHGDEAGVEEKKEEPPEMPFVEPQFHKRSLKFMGYTGPGGRLSELPQEIKEAGHLINQVGLSRRDMDLVNAYIKFQFRNRGCDVPTRLPDKRAVERQLHMACDRNQDGSMRAHTFIVPEHIRYCKQGAITFKVPDSAPCMYAC